MGVAQIEPIDAEVIQMICKYLESVETVIRVKSESRHSWLIARRARCVRDAEVAFISTPLPSGCLKKVVLPRWIRDSMILWAGELIEPEMAHVPCRHIKGDRPAAISVSRYVSGPFRERRDVVRDSHTSSRNTPSYLAKLVRPTTRPFESGRWST